MNRLIKTLLWVWGGYKIVVHGSKVIYEHLAAAYQAGKAAGYRALVESAGGDAKAAATLLMIEKLEEIVARQTEAISKLKIDKVTVWDSGNPEKGSSTANFVSSLVKTLPPIHDVAKMAGVELPEYLGRVAGDKPADPPPPAAG